MSYTSKTWYWVVNSDETKVWSAFEKAYIQTTDEKYQLWLNEGRLPTRIISEQELCDVINQEIILEIEKLEAKQLRPLREILLNMNVEINEDRLLELDSEIQNLRFQMQLVPLT